MTRLPLCVVPLTHRYDSETYATEAGEVALGHVTNYAQNMDGTVWDLHQLQQHMGERVVVVV